MAHDQEQEKLTKLIDLVKEALSADEKLRETYRIGDKFRFIRDRLQALLQQLESETLLREESVSVLKPQTLEEDELVLYVHLYNAQGGFFRTWQPLFTNKAFFDFSVNRPLYQEQAAVEAFISTKANRQQHGYLAIRVKKTALLMGVEEAAKDNLGQVLSKAKEGSFQVERLLFFRHNEQSYVLGVAGELIKQP